MPSTVDVLVYGKLGESFRGIVGFVPIIPVSRSRITER